MMSQINLSVYKNTEKTGKPMSNKSLNDILNIIKDNPNKHNIIKARELGKNNPDKREYETYQNGKRVKVMRNFYEHVKIRLTPCVTWGLNLGKDDRRRKNEIKTEQLTGLIYYDIDDFSGTSLEEVQEFLTGNQLNEVVAVWKSFGGNGLGFIILVEDLTPQNFKISWKFYEDRYRQAFKNIYGKDLNIDNLKDVTRINILSYDPDIFIRPENEIYPVYAQDKFNDEEVIKKSKSPISFSLEDINIPYSVASDHLISIFKTAYKQKENYNQSEGRLNYTFYQRYFAKCNIYGIPLDIAHQFLVDNADIYDLLFAYRSDDVVYSIGVQQYDAYSNQFNSWIEYIINYEDSKIVDIFVEKTSPIEINQIIEYYVQNSLIFHKTKFLTNKIVSYIAFKCKETGILKNYLLDQLTKRPDFKDKHFKIINDAYQNIHIPFGIILEPIEEVKKKKFDEWASKQRSLGFEIKDESYSQYTETITNHILSIKGRSFLDKIRAQIMESIKFGLPEPNIIDFFTNKYPQVSFITFMVKTLFDRFSFMHGKRNVFRISKEQIYHQTFEQELSLSDNEYLSDLDITFKDNSIIWADTGTGKTTLICEKMNNKRIVLVPVIPLLTAIDHKYDVSVYYGDKKTVKPNDNLIICTYKSFSSLYYMMKQWDNCSYKDYEIHVDEGHNFTVSDFRNKEMNFILDHINEFKKSFIYTGTWVDNAHPSFDSFTFYRIKKEKESKKLYEVTYKNRFESSFKLLNLSGLNVLYLQNKKQENKLGELYDFLIRKGVKKEEILFINADTKEKDEVQKIIKKEIIPEEYKVVICTSIMIEGINIKNTNIKTIHFLTYESPHLMEQLVNRFRVATPDAIYIFKGDKQTSIDIGDVNLLKLQKSLTNQSLDLCDFLSKSQNVGNDFNYQIAAKSFMEHLFSKNKLVRLHTDKFIPNYLYIAYKAFVTQKTNTFNSLSYLMNILEEYNWSFEGKINHSIDMDKQLKKELKTLKTRKKNQLIDEVTEIVNTIKNESKDQLIDKIDERNIPHIKATTKHPLYEISLRKKMLKLLNYIEWEQSIILLTEWVQNAKLSDNIFNKWFRQIKIHYMNEKNMFNSNNEKLFDNKFYKYYFQRKNNDKKKEKLFSELELKNLILEYATNNKIKKNLNSTIAINTLKKYVELIPKLDNEGNLKYAFGGLNIERDFIEQSIKIKNEISKFYENGNFLTKKNIVFIVNSVRKSLPIYGLNICKITDNQCFDLFTDYCELDKVNSRQYEIVNITPNIIKVLNKKKMVAV
jgi:hypothetical protein